MLTVECAHLYKYYRGADKSLAWPGRKQARKDVRRRARFHQHRDASCQVFFLQGKAPKEIHAILTETLACVRPGRAKDLSAPLNYTNNMYSPSEFHLEESINVWRDFFLIISLLWKPTYSVYLK